MLDTALALQLKAAGEIIVPAAQAFTGALIERAREHRDTLSVGRTHGIHAEPTTFGIKLAGLAMEADRNVRRLREAFDQVAVGALSGAVGTYSATDPGFEARVLARVGLEREPVSTQVVPRDRHARAAAGDRAGRGRPGALRHRDPSPQRTEVLEGPSRSARPEGQLGDAPQAQPDHHRAITGLARVLRGNAQAAVENVALWHERDISHSGAERVILPDSTILIHYMLGLATRVAGGMTVDTQRMAANLELTHGALFSQRVLLALVAPAWRAMTPTGSCRRPPSARGTRASRCVSCSPTTSAPPGSTSRRSSTTRHYTRHARRSSPSSLSSPRRPRRLSAPAARAVSIAPT